MIKYIFLGIVQGLTEFLPVSSSAHLVILERVFGITQNQVAITVILHLGTGCSLLVFFFKDLLRLFKDLKLVLQLFITTLITVIIALAGKDFFESLFSTVKPAAFALIVTGVILILTKKFMHGSRNIVNIKDAIILGFTQSVAIVPGISRSGITISTFLFRNIGIENSFRFSFLAAIPVIFGAALLEAKDIDLAMKAEIGNLLMGFFISFFVGILSLILIKKALAKAKLYYFGYYCIIVALITLIFVK